MDLKRAFDVCASAAALAPLSPLLAGIAVAVRLDSKGSPLYRQVRIGRGGKPFEILKFRSMVKDADRVGPYHTDRGDPRITRVGAVLRKTSLDELPQLLNILKGDMSVVGPRPDVPAMQGLYAPEEWQLRHTVRPGLTGLAQATLRSEATPEERKALDLEYARGASLALDARVIALTVRQVLCRGSY